MAAPSFVCPHCGAEVTIGATACPECGSDERTGWSEDAQQADAFGYEGYEDGNDFDYDAFVEREFGERRSQMPRNLRQTLKSAIGLVLIAALIYWLLF